MSPFGPLIAGGSTGGLALPDLEPEAVARRFVAVWDGLQALWLVDPSFDLGDEILASFR
ncbi:hypothetical protein GCM10009775_09860 [Microbacterium aoyamense]|uniref:Uncharacterized protein n=1 Tax=Microbacterium aoyamense TaxID=344166 RepID=A0ABP5ASR6_9MICO|nr:hypothetical protein [Microbacterium aoyamense]